MWNEIRSSQSLHISCENILRFKTEQLDNEQNQIKVKPLPTKNVPGIVDDFIPISLEKDFSKKLVSADIELFDTNAILSEDILRNSTINIYSSYTTSEKVDIFDNFSKEYFIEIYFSNRTFTLLIPFLTTFFYFILFYF